MIILVCLVLLVLPVSAASGPDQSSTIVSSRSWVVANSTDHATIIVVAQNISIKFPNATVAFSVNSTDLGTISPASAVTDANGVATGVFTTNKKSGTAIITAVITYGNVSVEKTISQNIDHDTPYTATFDYENEITVGTETPFNISFKDKWGNPIDNRKSDDPHSISLHISSVTGAGAFDSAGTFAQDITRTLDAQGNVSVKVRADTVGGENIIWQKPFGAISDHYESILGITNGIPYSMIFTVHPDNPASLPADGADDHKFTFDYNLYDKYGNPASNQTLAIHSSWSGDTDLNLTSNGVGLIEFTYGPHDRTGNITIAATARSNTTVTVTKYIEFYSTAPVNMVLMASPETMASRDADSSIRSNITAEVTDIMGNPVPNETVYFTLGTPTYDGTYTITSPPALGNVSAVTDENGFATVPFTPGGFTRNSSDLHYTQQATGHCVVTATWGSVHQNVQLTWKNYPYLSVETSVSPLTIAVNDTIDVTIKLKGDGWALEPNPIDAVLVIDRSGSMGDDNPTRISSAKSAALTFVSKMSSTYDRIGVVSFAGYTSGTDTRTDISLTSDYSNLKTAINSLKANGATETRDGLKQAIDLLIKNKNPNPKTVRAIILMTDGNYNWLGNPLGRGTGYSSGYSSYSTSDLEPDEYRYYSGMGDGLTGSRWSGSYYTYPDGQLTNQNMSVYARNNNIRLYMISFASKLDPQAVSDMQVMADSTGGFYQHAPDAATLAQIYTLIAGDLNTEAGVNTTMSVKFDTVNVTGVSVPGAEVYDYVYDPMASTAITWQDKNTNVTDQTNDWNDDHHLDFNIGTIRLNETWQSVFRLKIKEAGNIEVFGNSSSIVFNNGTDSMSLPKRFVNVINNITDTGVTMQSIQVSNLQITQTGVIKDFLPARWEISYPGKLNATERIYYSNDNMQTWIQFDSKTGILDGGGEETDYSTLDVRSLPAGTYYIRVVASADDALGDEKISSGSAMVGTAGKSYIKLE
ncbi:MAG: VWA domain-containing protein [Methanoregula sp.]|jgi:hypothetical protein